MKKTILLALAIVATLNLSAQNNKEKSFECKNKKQGMELKEKKNKAGEWICKKQEQRKAYILGHMELKEAEKAAFEAIYDNYRKELAKSNRKMKLAKHQMNDSCSNEQYTKCLDTIDNERNLQSKLDSEFYQAMKKTLSSRQIYLYYKSDKEFNKLMMREMHQKREKGKK